MGGAVATLNALPRVVPILHSGPGCSLAIGLGQISPGGLKGSSYMVTPPCSVMLEREVVFGGLTRLSETISGAIDLFDADVYCVLGSCTAAIIGEDAESVVSEHRNNGNPVLYVDSAGFTGDTYFGYNMVLAALARHLPAPSVSIPAPPLAVNVFGIVPNQDLYWQGNLREIRRVLAGVGIHANIFFGTREGVKEFRESAQAAANIILSPWLASEAEEYYASVHGIPALRFDSYPIGPTETSKFLRAAARALHVAHDTVETWIAAEELSVYEQFAAFSGVAMQEHIALVGDAHTAIATLRFLVNDMGHIPTLVIITDNINEEASQARIQAVLQDVEYRKPPDVYFENDQWNIQSILRRRRDDVTQLYGSSLDREIAGDLQLKFVGHFFPNTDKLVLDKGYAGYNGCLRLLEDTYSRY
jgi:nitrogenase molybdenum-iron protein beta chain